MISKATIFLNFDKSRAVAEGSKEARFLLVRTSNEVDENSLGKYPGALEMAQGAPETSKEDKPPVEDNKGNSGAPESKEPPSPEQLETKEPTVRTVKLQKRD